MVLELLQLATGGIRFTDEETEDESAGLNSNNGGLFVQNNMDPLDPHTGTATTDDLNLASRFIGIVLGSACATIAFLFGRGFPGLMVGVVIYIIICLIF